MGPQITTGSRFQRRTTLSPRGRHEQRPEEKPEQIPEEEFETTRRPITPLGLLGILNVFDTTLDDLTSSTDPENLAPYTDSIETAKEKAEIIREEFANTGKISPDKLEDLNDIVVTIQGITDIEDDLIDPLAIDDIKKAADDLIKVTIFLSPFLPSTTSTLSPQITTGSRFQRRTTLSPRGRHEQRPEEVFETTRRPITPLGLLGALNVFDTTLDDLT